LSTLVRASRAPRCERTYWPFFLAGIGLATLCAFLILPGSIASKTHLALHGICAQRPSHSLHLGGAALPLDARMTGIYIGTVIAALWLMAVGGARRTATPPRGVLALLALFVVLLAADGFNALAVDLGLPHLYPPANWLRLVTGILGGTAMGVALAHLLAATLWARPDRRRAVVERPALLIPPILIALAVGGLALSGLPILFAPFAVGLFVAALGVFAAIAAIALALVTNRGWAYGSFRAMAPLVCGGLIVAIGLLAALSWARLLAESWLGLPKLT
jgi:uncharacterized membrane protein